MGTVLLSSAPQRRRPAYPKRLRAPFGGGRPGMVSDSAVAGSRERGGCEGRGQGSASRRIDWLLALLGREVWCAVGIGRSYARLRRCRWAAAAVVEASEAIAASVGGGREAGRKK